MRVRFTEEDVRGRDGVRVRVRFTEEDAIEEDEGVVVLAVLALQVLVQRRVVGRPDLVRVRVWVRVRVRVRVGLGRISRLGLGVEVGLRSRLGLPSEVSQMSVRLLMPRHHLYTSSGGGSVSAGLTWPG